MNKDQQIAAGVLKAVGGKENISLAQHCMTRLRFTLKNESVPKDEEVKKIPGVLGVARSGGQYQVIIGTNVPKVYDALCSEAGLSKNDASNEGGGKAKEKLTPKVVANNIMNYLSGSFTPLIPVIIAAAMFRTISMILGPTMLHVIEETSDLYVVCDFVYNAAFYFLPVFLGYSAAKKIGTDPGLGMLLGCSLLVPGFVALVGQVDSIRVFGIPAPVASYAQTVLPIVIAVFFLKYVHAFFQKHVPEILVTIMAPFLTMIVMIPLTFCFAAPVGSLIGTVIGNALFWFADHGGFIAVAVLAAVYQFLVLAGMHHVIGTLAITVMLERGVEFCCRPASAIANWACYGMALGAFLAIRAKKEKALAAGYFVSGLVGGITEPAMFGLGIRYKRPFIGLAIGGFVGGLYAGITHVGSYTFASPGFMSVVSFLNGGTANFTNGIIACVLAMVAAAIATFFLGGLRNVKTEEDQGSSDADVKALPETSVRACVSGKVLPIEELNDGVFSSKALGDGIAIEPEENVITAPCDAVVMTVMAESKHAVGLRLANGAEILIHEGLDTVDMNGDGFTLHVAEGDHVCAGDKLITFDPKKIEAAGHAKTCIVVVTNMDEVPATFEAETDVRQNETVVMRFN